MRCSQQHTVLANTTITGTDVTAVLPPGRGLVWAVEECAQGKVYIQCPQLCVRGTSKRDRTVDYELKWLAIGERTSLLIW